MDEVEGLVEGGVGEGSGEGDELLVEERVLLHHKVDDRHHPLLRQILML